MLETNKKYIYFKSGKRTKDVSHTEEQRYEWVHTLFTSGTKQWSNALKYWQKKTYQPKILYPKKISFKTEGKIKIIFKQTKVERIHCQLACTMLMKVLQAEGKWYKIEIRICINKFSLLKIINVWVKRLFFPLLFSLKNNLLFKAKINMMYYGI